MKPRWPHAAGFGTNSLAGPGPPLCLDLTERTCGYNRANVGDRRTGTVAFIRRPRCEIVVRAEQGVA